MVGAGDSVYNRFDPSSYALSLSLSLSLSLAHLSSDSLLAVI